MVTFYGDRENFEAVNHIWDIIEYHIQPFKTAGVIVRVHEEMNRGQVVVVEIMSLPNDICVLEHCERWFRGDLGYLATEIGLRAGKFFRDLPKPPIDDNVVLSEN